LQKNVLEILANRTSIARRHRSIHGRIRTRMMRQEVSTFFNFWAVFVLEKVAIRLLRSPLYSGVCQALKEDNNRGNENNTERIMEETVINIPRLVLLSTQRRVRFPVDMLPCKLDFHCLEQRGNTSESINTGAEAAEEGGGGLENNNENNKGRQTEAQETLINVPRLVLLSTQRRVRAIEMETALD